MDESPPPDATTGWPALDDVLCGIQPGDNIVWAVDQIENYQKLVIPYEAAARRAGRRRVYFHQFRGQTSPVFSEAALRMRG